MTVFSSEVEKGRPAGAPEFLAFSPKNGAQVRFYCRPSFWRWVEVEFDPYITNVLANKVTLSLDQRKISVSLQYEAQGHQHYVFSKREVPGDIEGKIVACLENNGIHCEFLEAQCSRDSQVHVENLLYMLSHINKHREIYTEKNLVTAAQAIDRCDGTLGGAVHDLLEKYPDSAAALLFELVRRGRAEISDARCKAIGGRTKIDNVRVRYG
jgi:hypothetical protein